MSTPTTEFVWEKYSKLIYKVAGRLAEKFDRPFNETLSEAIWRVFTQLDKFDPERAALSTFVYRCAYFGVTDWAMKERREVNESDLGFDEEGTGIIDATEARPGFLESLLGQLSPDARELARITLEAPEELDGAVTVARKVSGRRAVETYMIDALDWTTPRVRRAEKELAEWLG